MMIETIRLRLRPWTEGDRDAFAAMNADPQVMVDAPRPLSRENSDRKLDRYAASYARNGLCRWLVEGLDGEFLGYAGVMPVAEEHPLGAHYDVGWRLVRSAWGRGYATEAARAALDDVFDRAGLAEVLSYTAPDNQRSQAVMRRLGLVRDPGRDFVTDDRWTGLTWVARPGSNPPPSR